MYIIINEDCSEPIITIEGHFPLEYLSKRLENGEELIIISLYSNVIKIPNRTEENGIVSWEFTDYRLPINLINSKLNVIGV
jgi:hypothetical protein